MKKIAIVTLLIIVAIYLTPTILFADRGFLVKVMDSEMKNSGSKVIKLYDQSYALVIGINNYTHGWPRLSGAIKDAQLVAKELEKKGFEVTLLKDLNSIQLDSAFKEFFIVKGEVSQSRLFVWFAGHGHSDLKEGFIIPADAPRPNVGSHFTLKALSMRRFGEYVRLAKSKHVFTVFDSCFSGTIFSNQRSLPPAVITQAATFKVRQFLSSGSAEQKVSDDGMFRKLFVRAIQGEEHSADANRDGYLTGSELGMFLTTRLTNLTNMMQTPRYGKLRDPDFDRGDFVFKVSISNKDHVLPLVPPDSIRHNEDTFFWQSILNSNNPKSFEIYLSRYPNGQFAEIATLKILELKKSQQTPKTKSKKLIEKKSTKNLFIPPP